MATKDEGDATLALLQNKMATVPAATTPTNVAQVKHRLGRSVVHRPPKAPAITRIPAPFKPYLRHSASQMSLELASGMPYTIERN
jgi:hypothetical protein